MSWAWHNQQLFLEKVLNRLAVKKLSNHPTSPEQGSRVDCSCELCILLVTVDSRL